MMLTAAFKGLRAGPELLAAVEGVLEKVELLDRADSFAVTFSGGMKRRLSVAMAIVGEVDVIFFDEVRF